MCWRGELSWDGKKFSKGRACLYFFCWAGLYRVFNKTLDLTPHANSSSRNRLTVLEAHLSKPVVSTSLHFI